MTESAQKANTYALLVTAHAVMELGYDITDVRSTIESSWPVLVPPGRYCVGTSGNSPYASNVRFLAPVGEERGSACTGSWTRSTRSPATAPRCA